MLLFFHFVRFECAVSAWAPGKCKNIYCSSAVAPVEVVWLYVFGSSLNIFTLLYAKPIDWLLYARAEFFVRLENLTKNWQVIQDFSPVTKVFQYLAMVSYYWQKKKRQSDTEWLVTALLLRYMGNSLFRENSFVADSNFVLFRTA